MAYGASSAYADGVYADEEEVVGVLDRGVDSVFVSRFFWFVEEEA